MPRCKAYANSGGKGQEQFRYAAPQLPGQ